MQVLLLNDTRADPNPGCQATVSTLARQLAVALDAQVCTRPRGEGYDHFAPLAGTCRAHDPNAWHHGVNMLARDEALREALATADLVVANLEGTFHHHSVGALALGGTLALAHRLGCRVWAVNGSVEAIDPWLLAATLTPDVHVAVREPWSARWLRDRGVAATAAADAAFLAETFVIRHDGPTHATAAFYTPGVLAGTAASPEHALANITADLEALATAGWVPTFVQLEDRESPLADAVARLGWPVADGRQQPWQGFGGWLRQFGLVVSGRYHVLIFAAMAGVPAIARPSNTHKIEGLLELLGRPDAFARDLPALRARLAAGPPAAIDMATIRTCQQLARTNVPRSPRVIGASGLEAPPLVVGLDWTPPTALATVLAALHTSGPETFEAVLATTPLDTGHPVPTRVQAATEWRDQFDVAGFRITGERLVPPDERDRCARHTPALDPLGEAAEGARRVVTLQRAASRPAPSDAATSLPFPADVHVRFVVGDTTSFDRLAPSWRALAPSGCSMVVRADLRDPEWSAAQCEILAWCRSLDIAVQAVDGPCAVDWRLPAARGLLVATSPTPGVSRSFAGEFLAVARLHGWDTVVRNAGDARSGGADDLEAPAGPLTWLTDAAVRPAHTADHRTSPLRVALFGASSLGHSLATRVAQLPTLALRCVLDNDAGKWGSSIEGVPVTPPEPTALDAVDVIVVASMYADAIAAQVAAAGHGHKLVFDLTSLEATRPPIDQSGREARSP